MTAAAACPVSRQLGKEHPVSCLCKHGSARGESSLITEPSGSQREDVGRARLSLSRLFLFGSRLTWLFLT